MIYPNDPGMIWHVIFHPGKAWYAGRFSHVSLAGFCNDTWLHLDLTNEGVIASPIYAYDEVEDYLTLLLATYAVVKFGPSAGKSRSFFAPMTCVSFVKHVLGVRSGALRPDGLFRDLIDKFDARLLNEVPKATSGNAGTEATAG